MVLAFQIQAALIEDPLSECYENALTAKFQSDPLEKQYGQIQPNDLFLVTLKDVCYSENILKIKTLVKDSLDVTHH